MKILFACILLVCFSLTQGFANTDKPLVFAVSSDASEVINAYHQFLQQVYKKFGYDVEIRRLPTVRSYVHADIEKVDGVLISTRQLLERYQNLMVVPVPLRKIHVSLFQIDPEVKVTKENFRQFRIGILRGYMLSKKITEGMDRQIVNSYKSLAGILKAGRVDLVLALKNEMERFLGTHPEFEKIFVREPPIFTLVMYHFLNKKYADMIPQVSEVMTELIDQKVLEKLYEPYLPKTKKQARSAG